MKRAVITAAVLSAFFALPAVAQGQGMGGGMMGGGMMGGGGTMGGPGAGTGGGYRSGGYAEVDLTSEQRAKLDDIRRDLARKRQEISSRTRGQRFDMHDVFTLGSVDEAEARQAFEADAAARKEMFEASLDAAKRMNAVLTQEQREQLRQRRRGG